MQRSSIRRYIVYGLTYILMYNTCKKIGRPDNANKNVNQSKIENECGRPLLVEVINERWHTQEKEHREQERRFWVRSIRFSVFAVIIAAMAAGAAFGAFLQALRQADATDVGNQPWLKITKLSPIGSLEFSRDLINIAIAVDYVNIGHEPAQHIKIAVRLIEDLYLFKTDRLGELCSKSRDNWSTLSPNVSFPSEEASQINGGIYGPNSSPTKNAKGDLIGCLYYMDAGRNVHTTAFIYPLNGSKIILNAYAD